MGFIVYHYDTGLIYGTGTTLDAATADARNWAEDTAIAPEYCLRRCGSWRWAYATPELVAAVRASGGDVAWTDNSPRGIDTASLR